MEKTIIVYLYEFNDYKFKYYPFPNSDVCIEMKLTPEFDNDQRKKRIRADIQVSTKNRPTKT